MQRNLPFLNSAKGAAASALHVGKSDAPRFALSGLFESLLAVFLLLAFSTTLPGQAFRVESLKTITTEVPGATAAYSLDATYADASADNGVVTITGKIHGTTHMVIITASGARSYEVVVTDPPVKYPRGFLNPYEFGSQNENGYVESRFTSTPGEIQNGFDFSRRQEGTTIHAHLLTTELFGTLTSDEARTEISSASYEISTPNRDITILDKYLQEQPLGITGAILRGFHYSQSGWFLHAGYTSISTFAGLFLPTQTEIAVEGGYRFSLGQHSSLTGTYYHFNVPSTDFVGHSGSVGLLTYAYSPREDFNFSASVGVSGGIGASALLDYKDDSNMIIGSFRYAPSTFAALGSNNLRGLRSDFNWTIILSRSLSNNLTFYSNKVTLPGLEQSSENAADQLRYQLWTHWVLFGGVTASLSDSTTPTTAPSSRNLTAPLGLGFNARHFGVQGQYQYTRVSQQDSGGTQFQASANASAGGFSIAGFAQRQIQSPSLSFILNQAPGLQQALENLGIQATTIQQVEQLLSDNSYLFAAGYIKGATINVVPVRSQLGAMLNWMGRRRSQPQFSYNFLYNDNQGLTNSNLTKSHAFIFTQKFGAETFSLSYSLMGTKTPGLASTYQQMLSVGWRHQVSTVPSFIIPEHHGVISGIVFRDDNSKGTYERGMPFIANAEILLDDERRMRTGDDGIFRFPGVPSGKHKLTVLYKADKPTFFSTQSEVEVDENAIVNFGVGYLLSGLFGRVSNDAGAGVMGVSVKISTKDQQWTETTEGDGSFAKRRLTEGDYEVEIAEDSLPAGYLTYDLTRRTIKVGASTPGNALFTLRALRSIGGRVLIYDPAASKNIPVAGRVVTLKEQAKTSTTDAAGRYIFRDLLAGAYTVAVATPSGETTRRVTLPPSPSTLTNIDLETTDKAPAPPVETPSAPVQSTTKPPVSPGP